MAVRGRDGCNAAARCPCCPCCCCLCPCSRCCCCCCPCCPCLPCCCCACTCCGPLRRASGASSSSDSGACEPTIEPAEGCCCCCCCCCCRRLSARRRCRASSASAASAAASRWLSPQSSSSCGSRRLSAGSQVSSASPYPSHRTRYCNVPSVGEARSALMRSAVYTPAPRLCRLGLGFGAGARRVEAPLAVALPPPPPAATAAVSRCAARIARRSWRAHDVCMACTWRVFGVCMLPPLIALTQEHLAVEIAHLQQRGAVRIALEALLVVLVDGVVRVLHTTTATACLPGRPRSPPGVPVLGRAAAASWRTSSGRKVT
eukprot:scaffold93775_cov62-Phaeocystis_antarctica.AAC.4